MPKGAKSRKQELPALLLEDNNFDWNAKISDIQKEAPNSDSSSVSENFSLEIHCVDGIVLLNFLYRKKKQKFR